MAAENSKRHETDLDIECGGLHKLQDACPLPSRSQLPATLALGSLVTMLLVALAYAGALSKQISNNQEAIQSSKNEMVFYRHEYIARQPQLSCNKDAALSNLKTLMEKELDRIDTLATAVHESKDKMKNLESEASRLQAENEQLKKDLEVLKQQASAARSKAQGNVQSS